jgi:hypothetical protein
MANPKQVARLDHLLCRVAGFLLDSIESDHGGRWSRGVFQYRRAFDGTLDLGLRVWMTDGQAVEMVPPVEGTSELLQLLKLPDDVFGGRWYGLALLLQPGRAWEVAYNPDPAYSHDRAWRESWPGT